MIHLPGPMLTVLAVVFVIVVVAAVAIAVLPSRGDPSESHGGGQSDHGDRQT